MRFVLPIFLLLMSIPFFYSAASGMNYGLRLTFQWGLLFGAAFLFAGLFLLARNAKRKA